MILLELNTRNGVKSNITIVK